MTNQIMFRRIRLTPALTTAVSVSALVLIAVVTFYPERLSHAANHKRQQLTFEDRVAAQRDREAGPDHAPILTASGFSEP